MNNLKHALTSPILPWILLVGLVLSAPVFSLLSDDDNVAMRWKDGIMPTMEREPNIETKQKFSEYLRHPPNYQVTSDIDWENPHVAVYSVMTPRPPQQHLALRDLSESAQAHAIDFLTKYPKPDSWTELQKT